MELGLTTFVERIAAPGDAPPSQHERFRHVLEEAQLADQVGLDVFGIGEHHRPDYIASAPTVALGAIASTTERLRLTSAVTVLGSDDPVRVFQDFATLDLLSGGRAEIMAGRGSFIESFPLFGFDLNDYESLFREKLELLLRLRHEPRVTWSGRHRPALEAAEVQPRPLQDPLPVWLAVGGTPGSAVRAGTLGLPMMLAIIGGQPERFLPFAELYRQSGERAGFAPDSLPLGINAHGFLAPTAEAAADAFYPSYAAAMSRIGRERGWGEMTRPQFDAMRGLDGSLFVGDAQAVTEKILRLHERFGLARFLLQFSVGTVPHREVLRAIETFGTEVAPAVRRAVGRGAPG